jgi:hypothetical protein
LPVKSLPWQTWQPACGVRASVAWDETQPAGWTAPGAGASEFISEQPPVSSKRIKSTVMHDAEMKFFIFILLAINCEGAANKQRNHPYGAVSLLIYLHFSKGERCCCRVPGAFDICAYQVSFRRG